MVSTEKLYYIQPPIAQFTATVLHCESVGEHWQVVLDRTAFYPEGGGQPCDLGTLGNVSVLDVQEKDGIVYHTVNGPLQLNSSVQGCIDMTRRSELTQQHSGEHILSGTLHSMFGAENVGFHIGAEYLTMDTSIPISADELAKAEQYANQIIWKNVPIDAVWHSKEELAALTYRSKKELAGPVRIVTIPEADCCACCGTHVQYTGEIGIIKIIDWEKYKTGTRLFVVCGIRALRAFEQMRFETSAIRTLLSAKNGELAQAVKHQAEELESARFRVVQAENELFATIAQSIAPNQPVFLQQENLTPDALRRLCCAVSEKTCQLCAVFAPGKDNTLAYALAQTAPGADIRPLCKELNAQFAGRGGGKPGFVQGSLKGDFDSVVEFLKANIQNH